MGRCGGGRSEWASEGAVANNGAVGGGFSGVGKEVDGASDGRWGENDAYVETYVNKVDRGSPKRRTGPLCIEERERESRRSHLRSGKGRHGIWAQEPLHLSKGRCQFIRAGQAIKTYSAPASSVSERSRYWRKTVSSAGSLRRAGPRHSDLVNRFTSTQTSFFVSGEKKARKEEMQKGGAMTLDD